MPSLTLTLARDLRGRVTSIGTAENADRFAAYAYNADGSLAQEALAGGTAVRRMAYDALGRLTGLDDPAFALGLSYRQNGAASGPYGDGRISLETMTYKAAAFSGPAPAAIRRRYSYDPFGRLTAVEAEGPSQGLAQSYDANGNILGREAGSGRTAYAYQKGTNRLAALEPASGPKLAIGQDANGAVTALGGLALTRNGPGGRASGASVPSGPDRLRLSYRFAASGERVMTQRSGPAPLARLTVRSGLAPLVEVDSAGRQEIAVYGPGGLVALLVDGQALAVSRDGRGSTRVVTSAGKAVAQFDYGAFGALDSANSMTGTPLAPRIRARYTGQEWEAETGLYSYHARLYDPGLGRFLEKDPAGQGVCPYAYVGNDPVDYVDPTGAVLTRVVRVGEYLYLLDEQNIVRTTIRADRMQESLASVAQQIRRSPNRNHLLRDPIIVTHLNGRVAVDAHGLAQWIEDNVEDGEYLRSTHPHLFFPVRPYTNVRRQEVLPPRPPAPPPTPTVSSAPVVPPAITSAHLRTDLDFFLNADINPRELFGLDDWRNPANGEPLPKKRRVNNGSPNTDPSEKHPVYDPLGGKDPPPPPPPSSGSSGVPT